VTSRPHPTGVILAGGASTRMGVDKAVIEVGGRPMVMRVADALREGGCDPVVCQGGTEQITTTLGLDVLPDPEPGAGPVPAILAALRHDGGPILVAACDLADLDADAVRSVIEAGSTGPVPMVAAGFADDRPHLLSFWPSEALDPLAILVADGVSAYRVALQRLGAAKVPVDPAAVRNVNRPEDLRRHR
jgi:molybdopterin-guanine dinucleotide biosynthesis protein A